MQRPLKDDFPMAKDPREPESRQTVSTDTEIQLGSNVGKNPNEADAGKSLKANVHNIAQAAKNKPSLKSTGSSKPTNFEENLRAREKELKLVEAELTAREVEVIDREIKCLGLTQELEKLKPLSGLYRVVKAMSTERHFDSLLGVIAQETKDMLKCDRLSVFVLEAKRGELWTKEIDEEGSEKVIKIPLASHSVVSLTARTGQAINIHDAYSDSRFDPETDRISGCLTRNLLCVPMFNRLGEVIGVFEAINKSGGPFTAEDGEWLKALAAVAGGLIEQAQSYAEIESFMDKTLEMLASTIDKRDPLTAGHSMRVTCYSILIGEALNLPEADLDVLRYSAMMHDYGKIGVPEAILWKNGRLTPEEYACVQTHARLTYDLLSTLPFTKRLQAVPFVASCHHEKLDGSGYYRGLRGQEIPFLARIITVADVFDALTSVRHYRNRMAITKVTEIMETGRGNHFDPEFIDVFYQLPADQVLKIMESERGQNLPKELDLFASMTLGRLCELCSGAKPEKDEAGLIEIFENIYNAGLPADYQALD
jgi:HD-GYP domain-containing protein (c-di-GMP phosphodiesterase class II)